MAMGVTSVALALSLADALAILRAHASPPTAPLTTPPVTIVTGSLSPYRLTPESHG
jgi:hypothetical protein